MRQFDLIPFRRSTVGFDRLDSDAADWDRVGDRIAISWELVAPRRLPEAGGR